MKTARPSRTLYIVLTILLILLPLLAVLQYRWIGEVSQADRQRLEETLNRLGTQFVADFDRELIRIVMTFQFRGSPNSPNLADWLAQRHDESARSYAGLVKLVFLARPSITGIELLHFDQQADQLEAVGWPSDLDALHENLLSRLDRNMGRQPSMAREFSRDGNPVLPIAISPEGPSRLEGPRPPEVGPGGFGRGSRPGPPPPPSGWIIVELDRKVLYDEFIPALVARHFAAHSAEYYIAIVSRGSNGSVIYKSNADMDPSGIESADLRLPLFSFDQGRGRGPGGPGGLGGPPGPLGRGPRGMAFALGPWELLVKHRSGSLDAAIESVRRRNLAIGFGILLLLTASVVLVVVSSHRARALAQLQMDFVARVSHELRTPLAIIRSAAYNVANGVVTDEKEVREYATMVQAEGQRLSHMVDQILMFSRTDAGRASYEITSVRVDQVVDRVVGNMSTVLAQAQCELEQNIASNLPNVRADERALGDCLQNLLSNAIKYGRSSSGIRIQIDARRADAHTVVITVADSGPGIEPADLPHIFEPFFRGKNARSDTPGSGLGLNLVSRMMNAQGGRITVDSEPGMGTRFTLHLTVKQELTA